VSRTINEDETLFLGFVEKAEANLNIILSFIESTGSIIDDLSLLRIGYKEDYSPELETQKEIGLITSSDIMVHVNKDGSTKTTTDIHTSIGLDTENAYLEGKTLANKNRFPEAISILYSAFILDRTHRQLSRLLGILCYKTKEYKKAIEVLNSYTSQFEREEDLLYYLAISYKKLGEYKDALAVSLLLERLNPKFGKNLLNLADVYRLSEDFENSKLYCEKVLVIEPENQIAKKILNLL
jgi:tetratricopeptide (TPR) repeat protein